MSGPSAGGLLELREGNYCVIHTHGEVKTSVITFKAEITLSKTVRLVPKI